MLQKPFLTTLFFFMMILLFLCGCGFHNSTPTPTATFTPLPPTATPTPTQIPTSTPRPLITPTPSTQEEEAWGNIACMDTQALQDFVDAFPAGTYGNNAKLYLSLYQKIEAIKSGLYEPSYVIPFDKLGERWQAWMKRRPDTGAVGIFRNEAAMGIFFTLPGCNIISMDEYGCPITPTGDGSIVAFRTGSYKLGYLNDIVIESYGEEILYFAVINSKGLVHLHGWGKITMPDGTEFELR